MPEGNVDAADDQRPAGDQGRTSKPSRCERGCSCVVALTVLEDPLGQAGRADGDQVGGVALHQERGRRPAASIALASSVDLARLRARVAAMA